MLCTQQTPGRALRSTAKYAPNFNVPTQLGRMGKRDKANHIAGFDLPRRTGAGMPGTPQLLPAAAVPASKVVVVTPQGCACVGRSHK